MLADLFMMLKYIPNKLSGAVAGERLLYLPSYLVTLISFAFFASTLTPGGDAGSRSSVRFWITLVVGGAQHTDPASNPKTRTQQY